MERLWTPWRYDYITQANHEERPGVPPQLAAWSSSAAPDTGCVFCNMLAATKYAVEHGLDPEEADRSAHILERGATCFLCLNAFPYSTGHILILPYQHVDSLAALPVETAREMIGHAQQVERTLRKVYQPAGLNFGLNLGEAAGAGVAGHVHLHALPRWVGDTNFMTVIADTRVLPEALDTTWARVRAALRNQIDL